MLSISMQLSLLLITIQTTVSDCGGGTNIGDDSCNFHCILGMFTTVGSFSIICIGCTCCAFTALNFKRLFGNIASSRSIAESQMSDVEASTQYNDEPVLSYDEVVNMDSLPPYIPGYTYNPNIVNTNNSRIPPTGSTGGEHNTLESLTNIPIPPPCMATTGKICVIKDVSRII